MKFSKAPFVYITLSLISGLVLSNFVFIQNWILILSILLGLFAIFKSDKTFITYPILIYVFVALGVQIGNENYRIEKLKDGNVIFKVESVQGNKIWKNYNVSVSSIKDETKSETNVLIHSPFELESRKIYLVDLEFLPIENAGNPGEMNSEQYWKSKGIVQHSFLSDSSQIIAVKPYESFKTRLNAYREQLKNTFKNQLQTYLKQDNFELAMALLLGDKQYLEAETKSSFSNAGAMHVLAVSGLHIGILLQVILLFFRQFSKFISRNKAIVTALIIIWLYALLIGLPASVVRAAFMFSVVYIGMIFSKNNHSINALFFSAFVLLLFQPNWLFDVGFQLSYLAMLGILTTYKPISTLWYFKNKYLLKVWQGIIVGLSAQVFTFPLVLYYFHQYPNYSILTNLFLMVIIGAVMVSGLISLLISAIPFVNQLSYYVFGKLLELMRWGIAQVQELKMSIAQGFDLTIFHVFVVFLLVLLLVFVKWKKKLVIVYFIGITAILLIVNYNRFLHHAEEHLYTFNNKKKTVVVRHASENSCFYTDKEDAEYLMKNYVKIYPGKVKFLELKNGEYFFEDKGLKLFVSGNGKNRKVFFERNGRSFELIELEKLK